MSLLDELNYDRDMVKTAMREAKERGIALAKAESEYQILKNTRSLELKDAGIPATLIQQIIKGDEQVNRAMFSRDCAQVEYDSAQEAINVYKLDARLLENQISREWNQSGQMI